MWERSRFYGCAIFIGFSSLTAPLVIPGWDGPGKFALAPLFFSETYVPYCIYPDVGGWIADRSNQV